MKKYKYFQHEENLSSNSESMRLSPSYQFTILKHLMHIEENFGSNELAAVPVFFCTQVSTYLHIDCTQDYARTQY